MFIKTDSPLAHNRASITKKIASFWDRTSEGWKMVWGPHIHHGFYENNESITPLQAQEKLIHKLENLITILPHYRILDVGCGMGGSSLYLAKKYQAHVAGITLSNQQVLMAQEQAKVDAVRNVSFKVEDALSLSSFENESFDLIWSLESCEQFYDKRLFLMQAHRVLKPGGKILLATWCSESEIYYASLANKYKKLCIAFDLPYMPTIDHYSQLLKETNYTINETYDWTEFVKKSWEIGICNLKNFSLVQILKKVGWRGLCFSQQLKLMQNAFLEGRVKYAVFIATK